MSELAKLLCQMHSFTDQVNIYNNCSILQCCWNGRFTDLLKFFLKCCWVLWTPTTSAVREGRSWRSPLSRLLCECVIDWRERHQLCKFWRHFLTNWKCIQVSNVATSDFSFFLKNYGTATKIHTVFHTVMLRKTRTCWSYTNILNPPVWSSRLKILQWG